MTNLPNVQESIEKLANRADEAMKEPYQADNALTILRETIERLESMKGE